MRERTVRVFAFLDELIGALPVPPNNRKLLQRHLVKGESDYDALVLLTGSTVIGYFG